MMPPISDGNNGEGKLGRPRTPSLNEGIAGVISREGVGGLWAPNPRHVSSPDLAKAADYVLPGGNEFLGVVVLQAPE